MGLSSYNEIRKGLVKQNAENMKMLKILVYERIKYISKNDFNIQEIIFWSEYFNVTIDDFILKVLMINYYDYSTFLKNKNVNIRSNIYNIIKIKQ